MLLTKVTTDLKLQTFVPDQSFVPDQRIFGVTYLTRASGVEDNFYFYLKLNCCWRKIMGWWHGINHVSLRIINLMIRG